MASNYFVSYDLMSPGQDYRRVQEAVESCGAWGKLEQSFYYVNSYSNIDEVAAKIWAAMDENDKLVVVNSTTNQFKVFNVLPEVQQQMRDHWNR